MIYILLSVIQTKSFTQRRQSFHEGVVTIPIRNISQVFDILPECVSCDSSIFNAGLYSPHGQPLCLPHQFWRFSYSNSLQYQSQKTQPIPENMHGIIFSFASQARQRTWLSALLNGIRPDLDLNTMKHGRFEKYHLRGIAFYITLIDLHMCFLQRDNRLHG